LRSHPGWPEDFPAFWRTGKQLLCKSCFLPISL
jgi:hypothetical protein